MFSNEHFFKGRRQGLLEAAVAITNPDQVEEIRRDPEYAEGWADGLEYAERTILDRVRHLENQTDYLTAERAAEYVAKHNLESVHTQVNDLRTKIENHEEERNGNAEV